MENAIPKSMISAFAILALTAAHAAGHEVRLTGMADGQSTAFEPPFLKIAPGDTVTFLPVDNHQRVESVLVPAGATPFQGALDQPFSVTLDAEGIYLYVSPPQQKMNVGGVIQAGRPMNLKAAVDAARQLEEQATANQGRWETYLNEIDLSDIPEIAEIMIKGDTLPKNAAPPDAEKGTAEKP